jgi:uncharacterized protein (TIGR03000 family)
MFRKAITFGGTLVLAAAAILWTAGPGLAAGPGGHGGGGGGHGGGGHFGGGGAHFGGGGAHFGGGGAHFSGGRFGGFHGGGAYRGGYGFNRGYYPRYGYGGYYRHYGYGGYYYPYYGGYNYYPDYGAYSYPYGYSSDSDLSTAPAFQDSSPIPSTSAYQPSGSDLYAPPAAQADNTAHLTVNVPADAQIWVEDAKTNTSGAVREFQSPQLEPGKRYSYEIRARWMENGKEVTQTREVPVTAGARVKVTFPLSSDAAKAPPADK